MKIISFDEAKKEKDLLKSSSVDIWEGFIHYIIVEYKANNITYTISFYIYPIDDGAVEIVESYKFSKETDFAEQVPINLKEVPPEVCNKIYSIKGSVKNALKYLQKEGFNIKVVCPVSTECFNPILVDSVDTINDYVLQNVIVSDWGFQYIGYTKEFATFYLTDKICAPDKMVPKFTLSSVTESGIKESGCKKIYCENCTCNENCQLFIPDLEPRVKLVLTILDSKNEDDIILSIMELLKIQCLRDMSDKDVVWRDIEKNMLYVNHAVLKEHNFNVAQSVDYLIYNIFFEQPDIYTEIVLISPNEPEHILVPVRIAGINEEEDDRIMLIKILNASDI